MKVLIFSNEVGVINPTILGMQLLCILTRFRQKLTLYFYAEQLMKQTYLMRVFKSSIACDENKVVMIIIYLTIFYKQ